MKAMIPGLVLLHCRCFKTNNFSLTLLFVAVQIMVSRQVPENIRIERKEKPEDNIASRELLKLSDELLRSWGGRMSLETLATFHVAVRTSLKTM